MRAHLGSIEKLAPFCLHWLHFFEIFVILFHVISSLALKGTYFCLQFSNVFEHFSQDVIVLHFCCDLWFCWCRWTRNRKDTAMNFSAVKFDQVEICNFFSQKWYATVPRARKGTQSGQPPWYRAMYQQCSACHDVPHPLECIKEALHGPLEHFEGTNHIEGTNLFHQDKPHREGGWAHQFLVLRPLCPFLPFQNTFSTEYEKNRAPH